MAKTTAKTASPTMRATLGLTAEREVHAIAERDDQQDEGPMPGCGVRPPCHPAEWREESRGQGLDDAVANHPQGKERSDGRIDHPSWLRNTGRPTTNQTSRAPNRKSLRGGKPVDLRTLRKERGEL